MEITEVSISLRDDAKLCGFANIILENTFVVRGLKIIHGMDRYFIAMPSRRKRDGSFADIAHPITAEFRKKLENTVLDAYWKEIRETRQLEVAG